MKSLAESLARMIETYRKPGETISAAASRVLFLYRPEDIDAAAAEAMRRERWRETR